MSETPSSPRRPLDIVNLALVDVNGAVKPYLNVFLYVRRDWDDGLVGLVGTISGLFAILVQTPAGALIDRTTDKRYALLVALVVLSLGATLFGVSPHFWPVLIGSCLVASVAIWNCFVVDWLLEQASRILPRPAVVDARVAV